MLHECCMHKPRNCCRIKGRKDTPTGFPTKDESGRRVTQRKRMVDMMA